ncbi:peptidoglycan editing factor PgeF [Pseudoruegeria sp. SHC-113]|uniref:peptidoglycan editing factor PgeF n=1 Tax=Pseudoruegeria sp. SHC-113 TaxID=2855439 RepID=UPI0021BA69C0|nr:peptidoglycan editing factor PgeF [Pseudoruegeria sp. SHC-113]MCT8161997.1 peptidoglycan editing factor PgeF [Pseudoruegeria sp. SHC-113]
MTLEILTSEALGPVRHGFFTRRGGASSGIFEGLNCGMGSSDQAEIVHINRSRVANAMEVAPEAMTFVHQIHSPDVLTVSAPGEGGGQADALVTATPGLALAILTADCQPVLLADPENGVIGAAHAGWKGTIDGVLENTVAAMEAAGAERSAIRASIGPSISQRAYEVGPEFFERFMDEDPENARYFGNGEGDRYLFNLTHLGADKLRAAGVGVAEWTGHCTYSDPQRFYSYRRSVHQREADYGRLISVIRL